MDVYAGMLKLRAIGWMCALVLVFSEAAQGQDYVVEPGLSDDFQAKWSVGWDLNRLVRGQAVASLEHWFHPEFSAYILGGTMVARPWAPLPGAEIEWNAVESGSALGMGVRFHPPSDAARIRGFVGFEINRDRYTFSEVSGPNAWIHRELRALIGATVPWGNHFALTGHVAVNATDDAFSRYTYRSTRANMSIPGRIAGLQLAYRW